MSLTYSLPYLTFLFFLIALMLLEFRQLQQNRSIQIVRWLVISGYLLFFGLRGFIFSDWSIYAPLFEKMPTVWSGESLSAFHQNILDDFTTDVQTGNAGMEKGFIYFILLFKSLVPNYHAFIFFNVVIDLIILDSFFRRYSPYYALSFILLITFGGIIMQCDLLRNFKAILLFLISLNYLKERKPLQYFAINTIGILFHSTSILFFPLYFFLHKDCPVWLMWTVFIVGNILFLLKINYIQPAILALSDAIGGRLAVQVRIYFVMEEYNAAYAISIGYLERIITYLLILFNHKKLKEQNPHNTLFINAFILYFFTFFFLSEISIAVERLTLLFIFSYWVLYPLLLNVIKDIANKALFLMAFLSFSTLKIITLTQDTLTKYDNILFGIENYETRKDRFDNFSKPLKGQ